MMDGTENNGKKVEERNEPKEPQETKEVTGDDLDMVVGGASFDFFCNVCRKPKSQCTCGRRLM